MDIKIKLTILNLIIITLILVLVNYRLNKITQLVQKHFQSNSLKKQEKYLKYFIIILSLITCLVIEIIIRKTFN